MTRQFTRLEEVVDAYIVNYREKAWQELRYFQTQLSLEEAVRRAALAQRPNGKRFIHQSRIPLEVLKKAAFVLNQAIKELSSLQDFEELISLVDRKTEHIKGIGELTVYDTALRIGAKLGLQPALVYLHRGTRQGANALGLDSKRESIHPNELPRAFSALEPHEIEDCLCIYKDTFTE